MRNTELKMGTMGLIICQRAIPAAVFGLYKGYLYTNSKVVNNCSG